MPRSLRAGKVTVAHDLGVWLFDQPVGTLSLLGGRLRFQYGEDWLAHPLAVGLSRSLPLRPEPFDDSECRGFFAGLLPEGQLRRLIARQYQVSSQNDLAVAAHINPPLSDREDAVPGSHRVALTAGGGTLHWVVDCLTG